MDTVKSGYKTTEFWLSLLATLLGAFMASGVFEAEHWAIKVAGLVLSALTALGYARARALTKATTPAALPPADPQ